MKEYLKLPMPTYIVIGALGAGIGNFLPNRGSTTGQKALHSTVSALGAIAGGFAVHYSIKGISALLNRKPKAPADPAQLGNVL